LLELYGDCVGCSQHQGFGCGGLGFSQPSINPSMGDTLSESFDMSALKVSKRVLAHQAVYKTSPASVAPTLRIAMVSSPMILLSGQ